MFLHQIKEFVHSLESDIHFVEDNFLFSRMKYPEIITDRLILRPTNVEDASFIHSLLTSPKWLQYIGDRGVNSENDAREYILATIRPQFDELGFSANTIIRIEDGVKIGTCGLHQKDGIDGYHIGFAFLPEFQHKGYGFEAASALLQFAQERLNQTRLSAIVLEENSNSRALLEKLGFSYSRQITFEDDPEDLMLYEVWF